MIIDSTAQSEKTELVYYVSALFYNITMSWLLINGACPNRGRVTY